MHTPADAGPWTVREELPRSGPGRVLVIECPHGRTDHRHRPRPGPARGHDRAMAMDAALAAHRSRVGCWCTRIAPATAQALLP